ncbi:MAG: molybdopterin cofactor-binding domain-containing protein, partial [Acidobacteriota bacterium]
MPVDELKTEAALHEIRDRIRMFELDRRAFLRLCAGGLLVTSASPALEGQESGRSFGGHQLPQEVSAWIHIDADGKVTVYTGKVEIGQNIRTSLAQSVAEELRAPFGSITMVMGDTDLVPWDAGTFGSRSTPTMGPQLRTMAMNAREMLVEAAAARWKADPGRLIASEGRVMNPETKTSLGYGEITRGEKLTRTLAGDPTLTPAAEWKIAGTPVPKVDGREFVTGKHAYPSDVVRPGMLFGKVVRASGYHATLVSVDTS